MPDTPANTTDGGQTLVKHLRDVLVDILSAYQDPTTREAALAELGAPASSSGPATQDSSAALAALDQKLADQEALATTLDALRVLVGFARDEVAAAQAHDASISAETQLAGLIQLFSSSYIRYRTPWLWAIASALGFLDADGVRLDNICQFVGDAETYWKQQGENLPSTIMGAIGTALLFLPEACAADPTVQVRLLYGWDPSPGSTHPNADLILQRTMTLGLQTQPVDPEPGQETHTGGEVLLSSVIIPEGYDGPGVFLSLGGSATVAIPVGSHGVQVKIDAAVENAATLAIRIGKDPIASLVSDAEASLSVALERPESVDSTWNWPEQQGIHFAIGKFNLQAIVGTSSSGVLFKTKDTAFVVPRDTFGDGFLGTILPSSGLQVNADFGLGYTTAKGFYIDGGAKLEAVIPINRKLWIFDIHELGLSIQASSDNGVGRFSLGAGFGLGLSIGAFKLVVDGLGLKAVWQNRRDLSGKLGPYDFDVEGQLPRGVGASVDASAIKGGGYLYFDPDKSVYGGALELQFAPATGMSWALKAFGLLTTRMPGGGHGYSLLLVVSVDFNPPLGIKGPFGLTLFSIGGLIGLNHDVDVTQLVNGMRSHAFDDILFPPDPVSDAPRILNTLLNVFPPVPDNYLVGLMIKIGWGTSRLISLTVGVVVSFPKSSKVLLLGQLKIGAPDPKLPVVLLEADLLGVIDLQAGSVSMFVHIDGRSRMGWYSLTGDLALMAKGGHDGYFLFSAGGFNERFQPPAQLPEKMQRLAVDISGSANPRLRLEAYMALTSNTFQIGGKLQLDASAGPFSVNGYLQFDGFFQWDPHFGFSAELKGGLALRFEGDTLLGISFDVLFEGTQPWHFRGTATISILFWDVDVHVEHTWGEPATDTVVQAFDLVSTVVQALADPTSWAGEPPLADAHLVTLRTLTGAAQPVHPLGQLVVQQHAVPLGMRIDKIGTMRPAPGSAQRVDLGPVAVSGLGGAPPPPTDISEPFAPGQYLDLSNDDKLSRPSFEDLKSGARITSTASTHGPAVETDVQYQTVLLGHQRRLLPPHKLPFDILHFVAAQGAVARAQTPARNRYAAPGQPVSVGPLNPVVVASTGDLRARAIPELDGTRSFTLTTQALDRHLAAHPEDRGQLQIIGAHEAR